MPKKRYLPLIISLCIFTISMFAAEKASAEKVLTKYPVKLLEWPDLSSRHIAELGTNSALTVVSRSGIWLEVQTGTGQSGYIVQKWVTSSTGDDLIAENKTTKYNAKLDSTGKLTTNNILFFQKGAIRLTCKGILCPIKFRLNRKNLNRLHNQKAWRDLVIATTEIGFDTDLSYYYLGRAAEELGYYDAAEIYYDLSLSSSTSCNLLGKVCDGIAFPDYVYKRQDDVIQRVDQAAAKDAAAKATKATKLAGEYDNKLFGISYTIQIHVDNGEYIVTESYQDGSVGAKPCESFITSRGIKLVCSKNSFGEYYILNNKGDLEQHDSQGIVYVLDNKIQRKLNGKNQGSENKETCFSLGKRYGSCAGLVLKGLICPPEDDFVMPQRCRNKNDTQKGIESGLGSVL